MGAWTRSMLLFAFFIQYGALGNEESFISEPFNVTINEGEDIRFNCTPSQYTTQIAIWVINHQRYYWSDFLTIPTYTFNRLDNSLTINDAQSSLDGYSFRCIINRRSSKTGYLTIIVYNNITFRTEAATTTMTPSCIGTNSVYGSIIDSLKFDTWKEVTSDSSRFYNTTSTDLIESTTVTESNTMMTVKTHWKVAVMSVVVSVLSIVLIIAVICCVLVLMRSAKRHGTDSAEIAMKSNEVYDIFKRTLKPGSNPEIKMTRNQSYENHQPTRSP